MKYNLAEDKKVYLQEALSLLKEDVDSEEDSYKKYLDNWKNKLSQKFDEIRYDPSKSWMKKDLMKEEKRYYKELREYEAEQRNAEVINKAKLSKLITNLSNGFFTPIKTNSSAIRGYRTISSGNFDITDYSQLDDNMDLSFRTSRKDKIEDLINKLIDNGIDIKTFNDGISYTVSKFKHK